MDGYRPSKGYLRFIPLMGVVAMVTGGSLNIKEYGSRVFREAGVVWLEESNGDYLLQHLFMNSVTTGVGKPKPVTIAMTPPGQYNFTHMDLDHESKMFVMADPLTQKIMALSFDEYFTFIFYDLYEGTSNQVNGVTIDWKSDVVYWTDALYDVILAVSLTYPNAAVVIVSDGLEDPGDIAVHPTKGFLFWCERSATRPRLVRSGLAGEHVQDLVPNRILQDRRPTSLFIDFTDDRLYWLYEEVDSLGRQGIGSCDVNGQNITFHITRDAHFFGISVFHERVILAARDPVTKKSEVQMLDFARNYQGSPVARIPIQGRLMAMQVLDSTRQLNVRNPCESSLCPGVCIESNLTEKCFCSSLVTTDPEAEYRCEQPPSFQGLLFPKGDGIYSIKTNFAEYKNSFSGRTDLSLVVSSAHAVKAVTSDVRNNRIYFYESKTKIIKSVSTNHNSRPEVVSMAVGDVGGLAFDWLRNNLYWTDRVYGHVVAAKGNGDYPFVIVRNVEEPQAIAVHPSQRMLFWSCQCVGLLERAYLDGTSRRTLAPAWNRTVTAIAVDVIKDSVYMTTKNEILEMDPFGNEVRFIYMQPGRHFSGITLFHDYLLVTDTAYFTSGILVFTRIDGRYREKTEVKYPFFDFGNWYGVTFHHINSQPGLRKLNEMSTSRFDEDPCVTSHNYCDQLCVTAVRPECLCTLGYVKNETKCRIGKPYREFVILADQRQRRLLQLEANRYYSIPVQVLQQPHKVAYDPVSGLVYWTDLDAGTISRAELSGDNQEIIILNETKYFLNLVMLPEYRLLYFLQRPRNRSQVGGSGYLDENPSYYSQLMVYHVDTGHMISFSRILEEPRGLAINLKHGYIFLTDAGSIWQSHLHASQFILLVSGIGNTKLIATDGDYLYFTLVLQPSARYRTPRTQFVQCHLNGTNVTVLNEFLGDHVTSLAVADDVIYWGNSSSRAIHSAPVWDVLSVEILGPSQMLYQPTGLYLHPPGTTTVTQCPGCDKSVVCLPAPNGTCTRYTGYKPDMPREDEYQREGISLTAPCRIPAVQYGVIHGNEVGRLVPHGYVARVKCYPVHRASHPYQLTCVNSRWRPNPPVCELEYDICGTPSKGYKIYSQPGKYFVYPESTQVHVIVIGGGGGGYDVKNTNITIQKKAGDGGDSAFGTYLATYGGRGGTASEGGAGGLGQQSGAAGQMGPGCPRGGTAGVGPWTPTGPGATLKLFAGFGAFSHNCSEAEIHNATRYVRVTLGELTYSSRAGRFGGGAGSRAGGPGGGGGWSYLPISLSPLEVVPITVGAPGFPSYGAPASGAVIVRWGDVDFEKYSRHDFIAEGCLPDL